MVLFHGSSPCRGNTFVTVYLVPRGRPVRQARDVWVCGPRVRLAWPARPILAACVGADEFGVSTCLRSRAFPRPRVPSWTSPFNGYRSNFPFFHFPFLPSVFSGVTSGTRSPQVKVAFLRNFSRRLRAGRLAADRAGAVGPRGRHRGALLWRGPRRPQSLLVSRR